MIRVTLSLYIVSPFYPIFISHKIILYSLRFQFYLPPSLFVQCYGCGSSIFVVIIIKQRTFSADFQALMECKICGYIAFTGR